MSTLKNTQGKALATRASAVALTVASLLSLPAHAAPGSTSPYATDPQTSYVEDATSSGIGEVNMIACIMHALSADALVNQGPYIALVDKNKCDSSKRSSTSNAGATSDGAQGAASYVTATVQATRTSNTTPMITKAWLDISEEGMNQTIFVHIAATEAPSAANAYGQFRLDYCGKVEGIPGCPSRGYLEGTATGLNFYQLDMGDHGNETTAMRLASASATGGSGRLVNDDGNGGSSAFLFAYDSGLFRRADDNDDQCFSRDASDPDTGMSVWRYGLYDATTGERIERSSGFPIEFTNNGTTYHGYLGYYGLSLPPDANSALTSGTTVQKVDYSNDKATRTDYTVVKSEGRLMKFTRHSRTLRSMDQIRFTAFVGFDGGTLFSGVQTNTQYEFYWNEARGTFVATSRMVCDQNGCQNQALSGEQDVDASYWASHGGVQGYSQSLGGDVFINLQGGSPTANSAAVDVVFRAQDIVYPADLPAQLFCVQNCPTAASLSAYFAGSAGPASPYIPATFNNFQPTPVGNVVSYTTDAATVTLRDGNGAAVTFADAEAMSAKPQFGNGVRSGRLFTNLQDAECAVSSGTYCDYKVSNASVYYVWETGANNWNQFAAVKDSSGAFVAFDAPLQLNYTVPTGAAYGQYAGKSIVLQYGGFGDLMGLPGVCVSRFTNATVSCNTQDARYVPSFAIPNDGTNNHATSTDGQQSYLVKWLDREIRFAQKPLNTCSAAGLTLPSNVTLPTASDLKDPTDPASSVFVGTRPTVTSAPRVIHGEVKY